MADISNPASPRITLAQQGILVSEGPQMLHLHLTNGSTHETDPASADHYQISTFRPDRHSHSVPQTDSRSRNRCRRRKWAPGSCATRHTSEEVCGSLVPHRISPPLRAAHRVPGAGAGRNSPGALVKKGRQVGGIRSHHPAGVCVLLGHADRSLAGPPGQVPPALGAWLANIVFFLGGAFLLWRAERRPFEIGHFRARWNPVKNQLVQWGRNLLHFNRPEDAFQRAVSRRRVFSARFPMILDDYVLRDFMVYLTMILAVVPDAAAGVHAL